MPLALSYDLTRRDFVERAPQLQLRVLGVGLGSFGSTIFATIIFLGLWFSVDAEFAWRNPVLPMLMFAPPLGMDLYSLLTLDVPLWHYELMVDDRGVHVTATRLSWGRSQRQYTLAWESLAATNAVQEKSRYFELGDFAQISPYTLRWVLIPKQIFENEDQLQQFRELLKSHVANAQPSPATAG